MKCDICNKHDFSVDVVECPECGACPLLCLECAIGKPCPKCGASAPISEDACTGNRETCMCNDHQIWRSELRHR